MQRARQVQNEIDGDIFLAYSMFQKKNKKYTNILDIYYFQFHERLEVFLTCPQTRRNSYNFEFLLEILGVYSYMGTWNKRK